jgi:hypothetical protein
MADKKAYVLRIDSRKLAAIEKWAADEFRSTNGQLEWVVEQALKKAGRWPNQNLKTDDNTNNDDK